MRNKKIVFGLMSLFCLCANGYALDLTLDDTVARIVSESNDLKKADANVKKAQASLDAANANRWFKIDANATYMNMLNVEHLGSSQGIELPPELGGILGSALDADMSNLEIPDNIFTAGVSITQPIYTFGKIGNAVDSVRSAIKMSETSREMTRREIVYSATDMYWTAKMTDEIVKLAKKDLNNAIASREQLTSAGRANRSNLVKIESDIATKEINLSDARFNRDTAHRMLKIFAGIDVDEEINLVDDFPKTFSTMEIKKLEKTPQWDVLNQQVMMYESQASSKRANAYPTLAATGSYSYSSMANEARHMFDSKGGQNAYWGLALQVPLFSGGLNKANATVDAMNAEAARQDLEKSKKIVSEQYNNAIKQYNHLRDNLKNLENARDLAAKAFEYSQQRFSSGQTSAVELSEVASGLYQLDMALLNAKYKILMSAESVKKLGE